MSKAENAAERAENWVERSRAWQKTMKRERSGRSRSGHYRNKMLSYRRETTLQDALVFAKSRRLVITAIKVKVIEVGTNRKPVCDFLLVINN